MFHLLPPPISTAKPARRRLQLGCNPHHRPGHEPSINSHPSRFSDARVFILPRRARANELHLLAMLIPTLIPCCSCIALSLLPCSQYSNNEATKGQQPITNNQTLTLAPQVPDTQLPTPSLPPQPPPPSPPQSPPHPSPPSPPPPISPPPPSPPPLSPPLPTESRRTSCTRQA